MRPEPSANPRNRHATALASQLGIANLRSNGLRSSRPTTAMPIPTAAMVIEMKALRYTGRPVLATLALGFVPIILADFGAERQSRARLIATSL